MKFIENILNRKLERMNEKNAKFLSKRSYSYDDVKENCRWILIDLWTGYALAVGEKMRCVEFFEKISSFRRHLFGEKIDVYSRELTVKGRPCVIYYYAGLKKIRPGSIVLVSGCLAGLSGNGYDSAGKPRDFSFYLKANGYRRKKIKMK